MRRPVKCSSAQGLLLVEAILAAIVIASGLVFLSRGLSSQLGALRTVEAHEKLVGLARSKLLELEMQAAGSHTAVETPLEGTFSLSGSETMQGASYTWAIHLTTPEALKDPVGIAFAREMTLTVKAEGGQGPAPSVSVSALWPVEWIPSSWPQQ